MITYFLLCGYTPFDRDSNLEEMQAILQADYSFTPVEYWRNVSLSARDFIKQCLTIDPRQRMSAHRALQHPWVNVEDPMSPARGNEGMDQDLLPTVKKNFNARRTLHKAIDTVRAINKLREGGGLMAGHMDGQMSVDPKPKTEEVDGSKVVDVHGRSVQGGAQGGNIDAMDVDDDGSRHSRGNAHGQTAEQIRQQTSRVQNKISEMWQRGRIQ